MKYCLLGNNDRYDNNAKLWGLEKYNFCAAQYMRYYLVEL